MTPSRIALAAFFVFAGVMHFVIPKTYMSIMPRFIPRDQHRMLVYVSGVAEIAGGIGVLVPPVRMLAGIGLLILLLAVFPANVQMLMNGYRTKASMFALAGLWFRLPLQPLMMWWVWRATMVAS